MLVSSPGINNHSSATSMNIKKPAIKVPNQPRQIQFGGGELDSFFAPAPIKGNPYSRLASSIRDSESYKTVVKDWDESAKNNPATKLVKLAIVGGSAMLGGQLADTKGPSGEAAGAIAGHLANSAVKPIVKEFTVPELESKLREIEYYEYTVDTKGPVARACNKIQRQIVNPGFFDNFAFKVGNDDTAMLVKGFVVPYEKVQGYVKTLLPKIKKKERTQSLLVPQLKKVQKEIRQALENGERHGNGVFVSCDYKILPDVLALNNADGLERDILGIDTYLNPSAGFDTIGAELTAVRHLNKKLPDIISYLKEGK